ARAARLNEELEGARRRIAELEQQLEAVRGQLEEHEAERGRALERERRRRDAEVARLEQQLTAARSELEEQRQAARRQAARPAASGRGAQAASSTERRVGEPEPSDDRFVPGRPSRLPGDVVAGTTEAASLLLHPGRKVLVDGYNVTRQHRGHLDLERQRTWLTQLLATAAATRRIRPVVVFDGERAGGGRAGVGSRDVEVRFTPAGITADDELVLDVEGSDEPVVVVTDDRELAGRVAACGADVIGTVAFLGAATGAAR
ncbi:MAG: NYN domain-containing protein, partial [Nitriliruptoraceae bacterium]